MLVGGVPTRCPDQVFRPGAPTRCTHQVPRPLSEVRRKILCTTYFLFENQSIVDFKIKNQSSGGDLDEDGCFP